MRIARTYVYGRRRRRGDVVLQAEIYNGHLPDESIDRDPLFVFVSRELLYHSRPRRSIYITVYLPRLYFASDTRNRITIETHFIALYCITYQAQPPLGEFRAIRKPPRKYRSDRLFPIVESSRAISRVGSAAAAADSDGDCVSSRRADRGTGSSRVPILVDLARNARGRRSVEYTCRRRRGWGRRGGRRQEGILFADVRRGRTTTEVHREPRCKESTPKEREEAGNKPRMALTRTTAVAARCVPLMRA